MIQKCNRCKRESILIHLKEPLCEYHWHLICAKEQHIGNTELMGYDNHNNETTDINQ